MTEGEWEKLLGLVPCPMRPKIPPTCRVGFQVRTTTSLLVVPPPGTSEFRHLILSKSTIAKSRFFFSADVITLACFYFGGHSAGVRVRTTSASFFSGWYVLGGSFAGVAGWGRGREEYA